MICFVFQQLAARGEFMTSHLGDEFNLSTALTESWRPAATFLPITATILMTDEDGATHYQTQVLYKNDEERQKMAAMGFEPGWTQAIDQLSELAAQGL